ncbi:MAG: hypothetical protein ACF787_07160, partial [Rhodopirellula sp. JB053]
GRVGAPHGPALEEKVSDTFSELPTPFRHSSENETQHETEIEAGAAWVSIIAVSRWSFGGVKDELALALSG